MTTNPTELQVRTPADLATVWRRVMGPWGPGLRSLWLVFLDDDGRPQPVVMPIDDMPLEPEAALTAGLARILGEARHLGEPVLLLSRPGHAGMTDADRRWGRALAPLSRWPVHLYTSSGVRVFAPDDLLDGADQ